MRFAIGFPTIAVALAAAVVFSCLGCGRGSASVEAAFHHRGEIFGTTYKITVSDWQKHPQALQDEALDLIRLRLEEVDRALSTYKPDSDLSRFTRARDPKQVEVEAITEECLSLAGQVFERSRGCFDPTVGPAVRLWGFGWDRDLGKREIPVPTEEAIEAARTNIGWNQLTFRSSSEGSNAPRQISSINPNLELDCSAIAKGLAVDLVCFELTGLGFEHFMVEIGGEVKVAGQRPGGGPWRLWIESPLAERPELAAAVELTVQSLATSGDYRNFRVLPNGQTISHTIDPRTALPVESPPLSVSVIGKRCAATDAWATALSVAGEPGLMWIEEQPGFEARMVLRPDQAGEAPRIVTTSGWPKDPR